MPNGLMGLFRCDGMVMGFSLVQRTGRYLPAEGGYSGGKRKEQVHRRSWIQGVVTALHWGWGL